MSKIARATQKFFGTNATSGQIAQYGSGAASGFTGGTAYSGTTATPALVQGLSAWLEGWFAAVDGQYNPAIEDMNATHWLFAYQLSYLFQAGIPEWDSATTYYTGSLVNDGNGNIYKSLADTNLNQALTVETKWLAITNNSFRTSSSSQTVPTSARLNKVSGTQNQTLPTAVGIEGTVFKFWKTDSNATTVTFLTTSAQTMSGVASGGITLTEQYSWAEFTSDNANWLVRLG